MYTLWFIDMPDVTACYGRPFDIVYIIIDHSCLNCCLHKTFNDWHFGMSACQVCLQVMENSLIQLRLLFFFYILLHVWNDVIIS